MKRIFILISLIIVLTALSVYKIAVDADTNITDITDRDSLTQFVPIPKKTYRNLNVNQLEDTIISMIKSVSPGLEVFNPSTRMLPACSLATRDKIFIYFDHNNRSNSIRWQREFGFRGNYFWETQSGNTQICYKSHADSIKIFPRYGNQGISYDIFRKKAIGRTNLNRSKFARSMCGFLIETENQQVKSIEGWYLY